MKDSKGNIYYTDLTKVWKISLDSSKTVVVSGVHTHELYMDEHDNLYGEHLWYNDESKDTWGHYVWRLKTTGELIKEINPTEGFLTNYSFARDHLGKTWKISMSVKPHFLLLDPWSAVLYLACSGHGKIKWSARLKEYKSY